MTCCRSNFGANPSVRAGVKNSQRVVVVIIIIKKIGNSIIIHNNKGYTEN